jgi:hypothetical protein
MVPSIVFGSLTLVFLMTAYFVPGSIDRERRRILAIVTALCAGLFTFFFTGQLELGGTVNMGSAGDVVLRSTGGIALFVFVLYWWRDDFRVTDKPKP